MKKFIEVNTQQLAPEKYLCPLSGKKFKGPEFVKKHIITKHGEKVEAVKKGKIDIDCFRSLQKGWKYGAVSFRPYLNFRTNLLEHTE